MYYALILWSWLFFIFEFALFSALWLATFYGLGFCALYLIHRCFPGVKFEIARFLSMLATIPVLFELIRLYQEQMVIKTAMIAQGPPISCRDSSGILSGLRQLISTNDSCLDYYRAVDRSVFWALNPLKVISSLILETAVFVSGLLGKGAGLYFTSLMAELPWIYQIPALFITGLCIVLSLFAYFGYEFRLFWRCIEIGRRSRIYAPPRTKDYAALPAKDTPKAVTGKTQPAAVAVAGKIRPAAIAASPLVTPFTGKSMPQARNNTSRPKPVSLLNSPSANSGGRQVGKVNELYQK